MKTEPLYENIRSIKAGSGETDRCTYSFCLRAAAKTAKEACYQKKRKSLKRA